TKAAEILRARGVPFRLVFAGRGPEIERLRGTLEKHDDVEIIAKFLTPAEAVRQFQRAAIVVAPYRDATQSGVVAAAFANGRPVVASRVAGLVDVILHGVNGLLTRPNDPVDLADALERVLRNEEFYGRLREGAQRSAATTIGWPNIRSTLLQAYADLG